MSHKAWKLRWTFWATSLALATLFTLDADSNAQEPLQPYAPPILHTFLDSANVYPESERIDQSSGTFFVGSGMLKLHPLEFIVAEVGAPLKRIPVGKSAEFWESEVKCLLLPPHGKLDRTNSPDEYGYLASEWSGRIQTPIVLLEKIY